MISKLSVKDLNDRQLWDLLQALDESLEVVRDEGQDRGWGSWWWECGEFDRLPLGPVSRPKVPDA
jgi:hypothetical protein